MKIENTTAVAALVASVVTFDAILEAPAWITILGTIAATFVGWQLGCLIEIIKDNWGVKDPQPDVTITVRKFDDLTAEEKAFIVEHETLHSRHRDDYKSGI